MFDIRVRENRHILLSGRLDASQAGRLKSTLNDIDESCTLDFKELEYISSAGLSVLLATHRRLDEKGHGLKLINLNEHIRNIFQIAGFDLVFDIE